MEPPDWYLTIRAARYSGTIKPHELENMPVYWRDRLLMAESAEQRAEAILAREAKPKSGKGRKGHKF